MNVEWTSRPRPEQARRSRRQRGLIIAVQRLADALPQHWLFVLNAAVSFYLLGAVLAPVLMTIGQEPAANLLYTAYGFTCHQLPERSYFLLAPDGLVRTYNVDILASQGAGTTGLLAYRTFRGNPILGYKVAISDRMVSMYGGVLLAGLLYALLRRMRVEIPALPVWAAVLVALPMVLDGFTHLIDDVTGVGWRATNAWAVSLFGPQLDPAFYTGTSWGSLNSLLRLVTGLLFGLGAVWFAYPRIAPAFEEITRQAEDRRAHASLPSNRLECEWKGTDGLDG